MIQKIGKGALWLTLVLIVVVAALGIFVAPAIWFAQIVLVPIAALGIWDVTQKRHSILRNFPIMGHMRFMLEDLGPELHQYLVDNSRLIRRHICSG